MTDRQPRLQPREQDFDIDAAIEMFNTQGWKNFLEDSKNTHDAILNAAPASAVTQDQWQYCRGMLDVYQKLTHYEEFVRGLLALEEHNGLEADI